MGLSIRNLKACVKVLIHRSSFVITIVARWLSLSIIRMIYSIPHPASCLSAHQSLSMYGRNVSSICSTHRSSINTTLPPWASFPTQTSLVPFGVAPLSSGLLRGSRAGRVWAGWAGRQGGQGWQSWQAGLLACCLAGLPTGWLAVRLAVWLCGWLAGTLARWDAMLLVEQPD